MGFDTSASGDWSTAMGFGANAQDYGTTAIGLFNETKETSNPDNFSLQNTAFVIGNGPIGNDLMVIAQTLLKFYLTAQLPLQEMLPPLLLLGMAHSLLICQHLQ